MGIDSGGTITKAAIYDQNGTEMAVASISTNILTPFMGHTERDMDELWDVSAKVIKRAIQKSQINPKDIKAVACTGHGKGLYLWGKDGKPARNGIISTDSRAKRYVAKWYQDGTANKVFEKTIQEILVSQPCALLAWVKDHEPEIYKNIQWIFEAKDYIRFKLTGNAYGELTDFSGTNLVNMYTRNYDDLLLELFGIKEIKPCLPPLISSLDLCGTISTNVAKQTGLEEGTIVAGGMFDIDACAIASGIIDEQNICAIAGTWSINEYIAREPVTNKSIAMNSIFCIPGYYLLEESSPTSAGNLEWFVKSVLDCDLEKARLAGENIYHQLDRMVETVQPEDCNIIFLPFLYGSPENSNAKGSLIGLTSYHTKAHIVRSIFEGIVFSHYNHIRKLLANRNMPNCIRLAGGAANSKVWVQIFADVCQIPIMTVPVKELGTLGCAINAAVTANVYSDFTQAVQQMVPQGIRVNPDPTKKSIYHKKFETYLAISDVLDSIWVKYI